MNIKKNIYILCVRLLVGVAPFGLRDQAPICVINRINACDTTFSGLSYLTTVYQRNLDNFIFKQHKYSII